MKQKLPVFTAGLKRYYNYIIIRKISNSIVNDENGT